MLKLTLTQNEVLDQFQLVLLLVLEHSLEIFLPAGNVDRVDRLIHHLSWRRLALRLTRWEEIQDKTVRYHTEL